MNMTCLHWSHIEAVVRGQWPYWLNTIRHWTPQGWMILYAALALVSLVTGWRRKYGQ